MILIPSSSIDDWRKLHPDRPWKAGYSAHALASRWQDANGFPPEVAELYELQDTPEHIELLLAIPEHEVRLPGGGHAARTDLWALGRTARGLVSMAVEATVREPLGPSLEEWMSTVTPGRRERWPQICSLVGLSAGCNRGLRYQLTLRAASALIEAQRFFARDAVLVVHSFAAAPETWNDLELFARELNAEPLLPGKLTRVGLRGGIEFHLAWAQAPAVV